MGLCLGSPRHHTEEPEHSVSNRPCNTEDQNCQNLKVYRLDELKGVTKNFKSNMVLREGGFGKVYKGWIGSNAVAIKKLNSHTARSFFEWQVNFLARLSHPNLVKLIGYCMEENELLLVSELMHNGSLEDHLFTRNSKEALSWDLRLKIAIGAGKGLAFLHTFEKPVIYRDFEACNILVDGLSDFGLVKYGSSSLNNIDAFGLSSGHGAPEYPLTGHLDEKGNVYGFGVVLLEMLTGLRALDNRKPREQWILVEWVRPCLSSARKLEQIMDARIVNQCSIKAALRAAELAWKCTAWEAKRRPWMKQVVEALLLIQTMGITDCT